MATNQVYSLKVTGVMLNQQVINQYHYLCTNGGTEPGVTIAQQLVDGWFENVWPILRLIQSATYSLTTIQSFCYAEPLDWFERVGIVATGSVGGEVLPPFVAWSFRYIRAAVGQRYGYKRIAGVAEVMQANGVISSTAVTAVNNAATALGMGVEGALGSVPTDADFIPFVASRPLLIGFDPNGYSALGCQYREITSQSSRKFGRGA